MEEGSIKSLEDPISLYLPKSYFENASNETKNITIEDLLTMTAGLDWKEDVTEYRIEHEKNWIKEILSQRKMDSPGTTFNYSTGLAHVMSAILSNATNTDIKKYADKYLFNPLELQ